MTFIYLDHGTEDTVFLSESSHEAEEEGARLFRRQADVYGRLVADGDDVISHPHQDHPRADPDVPLPERRVGRRHLVDDVSLSLMRTKQKQKPEMPFCQKSYNKDMERMEVE